MTATFVTAPPAAAAPHVPEPTALQCVLQPGVYGIVDSSGEVIGILIIYPDCRMEVFKRVALV